MSVPAAQLLSAASASCAWAWPDPGVSCILGCVAQVVEKRRFTPTDLASSSELPSWVTELLAADCSDNIYVRCVRLPSYSEAFRPRNSCWKRSPRCGAD